MLSESTIKQIAKIFCGDIEGSYTYKTGPQLVSFFNSYFSAGDEYRSGFPSRWIYVYDKLVNLLNANQFDGFLDIILSKVYLIREQSLTEVEAVQKSAEIYKALVQIVHIDLYTISVKDKHYHLVAENDDLVLIGGGGFANVYRQKSTGLIIKKLKDEFLTDTGIRSRFKREFSITKSLQDAYGIITVYSFSEDICSYSMEPAETTLERYILDNDLPNETKLNCIRQILYIMSEVHKRDIIHRDLSPNNIFFISGQLKIADFGLGKDLNVFSSHRTLYTNAVGQYFYCAPEQFMMLRDADKRSDVYSIGRVINFIMTGDPRNSHHIYRNVAEKATNSDAAYRYGDAIQLASFFEKSVAYHNMEENQAQVEDKLLHNVYDADIESYIYDMSATQISKNILDEKRGFVEALIAFMDTSEEHTEHIIQSIDQSFREVCGWSFSANDPFAFFAARILKGKYSFVVKETAANILRYVAWDVNRFSAQHLVKNLLNDGLEPMLEDIIKE